MAPPRDTDLVVRPLTDADREAISRWRYGGELSIYDPGPGAMELRAPDHVALADHAGTLLGYGTVGVEAQVPGGRYDADDAVVDVGLGLRPDLVGRGQGARALLALLALLEARSAPDRVRATVAAANPRATAFVRRLGFAPTHRFRRDRDGREFVQYERPAAPR